MKKLVRTLIIIVATPFLIVYFPFFILVWIGCSFTEWAKETEKRTLKEVFKENFKDLNECFNPLMWFKKTE